MLSDSAFLSIESLLCVDGSTAAPGSLLYMPAKSVQRFALIGAGEDTSRYLLDLGGDRAFGAWVNEQDLGPAILIPGWRLEVDPTSGTAQMYASLRTGWAYIVEDEAGLIGTIQPHQRNKVAISTGGVAGTAGNINQRRAMFSRWRIVAGSIDNPIVLLDSSLVPAPPNDD